MNYKEKVIALLNSQDLSKEQKEKLESIFPELKESKDEQSKNWILEYLYDGLRKSDEQFKDQFKAAIAWLEKKGEQKPVTIDIDKMVDVYRNTDEYDEDGNLKRKPVNCMIRAYEQGLNDAIEKVVLKPAWSEEDDNCLSTIIAEFSKCAGKSVSKDEWMRCNDFLNSLKDRVLPRPKQEWSDEDEEMIDSIIGNIKYLYSIGSCDNATVDKKVDWLKSLRPQSHWRPSEGQMIALKCAITTADEKWVCMNTKDLESLYEDLKKLTE